MKHELNLKRFLNIIIILFFLIFLTTLPIPGLYADNSSDDDESWEDISDSTSKVEHKSKPTTKEDASHTRTKNKKIKYWVAPMDPTYIRNEPGKSPMGMDLVPVYEDDNQSSGSGSAVRVDPVMVQNMGVRTALISKGKVIRKVRTIGEVVVAEDQISVINLRYSGWIEKIWADQTGQSLKQGEKLFQIYSPQVVAAQEEYLLAAKNKGPNSSLAISAQKRLLQWDIPKKHINSVLKSNNGQLRLIVRSPRAGYILHKNVVLGNRINAGKNLYKIGNLDRIWIKAEVYEYDAPWIKIGQTAYMYLTFQPGRTWQGVVSYIYPTINHKSRTLSIRLEFDNPHLKLKPGMFTTIYIDAQEKNNVLTVPTEAIIHSGQRQIVFVSPQLGYYEPREITTGLVGDNRLTEVINGLDEGETAVISGQFLLDSESQLQEAIQKMLHAKLQKKSKDSTKSSSIKEKSHTHQDGAKNTYYTCSMHPQVIEKEPGTCPICGMDLVKKEMP